MSISENWLPVHPINSGIEQLAKRIVSPKPVRVKCMPFAKESGK